MWVAHIFSAKNIKILYIESANTVNEMTLNELVKLTMLWTTGPRYLKMNKKGFNQNVQMYRLIWAFTILIHVYIYVLRGMNSLSKEITLKYGFDPSWKWVYSTWKEFAPLGSKFFPFRVDPFSEEHWWTGKPTGSHKNCLHCQKWRKIYQVYSITLSSHFAWGDPYYVKHCYICFCCFFFVNISYCIYPKYSDRQTCVSSAVQLLHRLEFAIHPIIIETRHQIVRWSCWNVSRSMVRRWGVQGPVVQN